MLGHYEDSPLPNSSPFGNPLHTGSITVVAETVQRDCELIVNGHLWVSGLVHEKWIGADLGKDFVECDRVDAEVLSKMWVELFVVFVG